MITVDIVTPTRKILDGVQAASVKLPADKGQIEVLPGHAELLTLLRTGVITIVGDGVERHFAISYGFAEVRQDKIIVMGETVEEATEIDKARAINAQKKAEEALASVLTEEHFNKYQLKLQRSIVRQQIAL